jgi:hypothetical protein
LKNINLKIKKTAESDSRRRLLAYLIELRESRAIPNLVDSLTSPKTTESSSIASAVGWHQAIAPVYDWLLRFSCDRRIFSHFPQEPNINKFTKEIKLLHTELCTSSSIRLDEEEKAAGEGNGAFIIYKFLF